MKSVLIIGMGRFGRHLAQEMAQMENEIMIVDRHEEKLEDLLPVVIGGKVADCRDQKVIDSLGVSNYDICFVTVADDFESSMVITSMLKSGGAPRVISLAASSMQYKLLKQIGADEVIFPDRDIAKEVAIEQSSDQVTKYLDINGEFGIYEMYPEKNWVGKTILQVDVRNKHHINIIGYKTGDDLNINPGPDYVFRTDETLLVIGGKKDMAGLVRKY